MLQLYYKKYRIKNNKCKITNFLQSIICNYTHAKLCMISKIIVYREIASWIIY